MMEQFEEFNATSLYCPKCKSAMPVRQRLLLVLPDGDLLEYVCARCGESLAKKKTRAGLVPGSSSGAGGRPRYM